MNWKMNWILQKTEKDWKWYECSNCHTRILVKNGEELPCYCKCCEKDYEEDKKMMFGGRCCGKKFRLQRMLCKMFGVPELKLGGMSGIKVFVDIENNKLLYYDENRKEWIGECCIFEEEGK